jgi:bifunctional DNase/RNase
MNFFFHGLPHKENSLMHYEKMTSSMRSWKNYIFSPRLTRGEKPVVSNVRVVVRRTFRYFPGRRRAVLTMRVLGLTLDETSHAPILLLQDEAGQELLPIWIGPLEAMAIAMVLGNMTLPAERPQTHDLFINLLHALKARLGGVELLDLREGAYYADLVLLLENGATYRLDCRPSDAVALALRAEAPIRARKELLRRAGAVRRSVEVEEACGFAFAHAPIHKMSVQAQADKGFHACAGQGAAPDRLAELLRALEPESKRKM